MNGDEIDVADQPPSDMSHARTPTHMPRGADPSRWNRRTRWCAGADRLPNVPHEASQHVRFVWAFLLARTLKEGWDVCKAQPKHDPRWYVEAARALAGNYSHRHEATCGKCEPKEWAWLWTRTDIDTTAPSTPKSGGTE